MKETTKGHLFALISIILWGTSFIATKELLQAFTATQIMCMRFFVATAAAWVICPGWHFNLKEDIKFLLLALLANTLYFVAENNALARTQASNVSILIATEPMMAVIILRLMKKSGRLAHHQTIGMITAFLGVILVVLNGTMYLHLSPAGDLLAIAAAVIWALYGILLDAYFKGFSNAFVTRKMMFYGLITALPLLLLEGKAIDLGYLVSSGGIFYVIYLGIACGAVCYITWSGAVRILGNIRANVYMYGIPLVTLVAGYFVLHERITPMGLAGIVLVLAGMVISSGIKKSGEKSD